MHQGQIKRGTAERIATVARLTREGWSARRIADSLGLTQRSVVRLRARAGLTDGTRAERWTQERLELFDRLLTEGWSYKEIARTHQVNEVSVSRRFPGRGYTQAQRAEVREALRMLDAIPARCTARTPKQRRFGDPIQRRVLAAPELEQRAG